MQTNQSPTRRSAIGFSLAAMAAGLTVPVLASAANPDADLIALCDQLVDLEKGDGADSRFDRLRGEPS